MCRVPLPLATSTSVRSSALFHLLRCSAEALGDFLQPAKPATDRCGADISDGCLNSWQTSTALTSQTQLCIGTLPVLLQGRCHHAAGCSAERRCSIIVSGSGTAQQARASTCYPASRASWARQRPWPTSARPSAQVRSTQAARCRGSVDRARSHFYCARSHFYCATHPVTKHPAKTMAARSAESAAAREPARRRANQAPTQ